MPLYNVMYFVTDFQTVRLLLVLDAAAIDIIIALSS